GSAGQVDPEPRTDDGGGAVGADYHAGANALLGAAVAAEDRTAYALSLFHEPQQPSAIVDLDSPGRSRCLDKYSLDSGMRENEVRITHIGQGERHVQHEAGPVVEELHPADRARAGGATPVERAPASQERGHRGQEAFAAIEVAGAPVALDEENPEPVGVGESERAGGAPHPRAHDDHVEIAVPDHGSHRDSSTAELVGRVAGRARAGDSNGKEAGLKELPRRPRSPERWIGTASIAHSILPAAIVQRATPAPATR